MTRKLTLSGMMTALAVVLMTVSKLLPSTWMQGGSVTLASMLPIIAASIILGSGWGCISGLCFAIIQMMTGFYPPPVRDALSYFLVIALDYVLAFGALGFAGFFYKILGQKKIAIPISAFLVTAIRFLCHFLSGILIWGVYAEEGQSVMMYSLIYNGTYMVPEIIITTAMAAVMAGVIKRTLKKQYKKIKQRNTV